MLEDFRLVHRFRVPFADVDMMRHVNNVAYATWAETLRTEYFGDVLEERIGGSRGIILAKTEIVYEKPIAYRENVAVGGRVGTIGGKSFAFASEVWSVDRNERWCDDRLHARCVRLRDQHDDSRPGRLARQDRRIRRARGRAARSTAMIVVTTDDVAGHRIVQTFGQVFGVVVRSRGLGGNIVAGLRSIVGGEIHEYTAMVEDSRRQAIDRMAQNASLMGANAVVRMMFDSSEMNQSMNEVVAYGTAVTIEPAP